MRLEVPFVATGIAAIALAGCVVNEPMAGRVDGISADRPSRGRRSGQAESVAQIHTELGQHYLQEGDVKTALEKLATAIKFDEGYAPAHTVLGAAYEQIGDTARAEAHYRRAQQLDPKAGASNNNLAVALCKAGKYADAQAYFERAMADPFYATPEVALTNAGICAEGAGDNATAQRQLRRALEFKPEFSEALFQLASSLYKSDDTFRARAFIQRYDSLGQATPAALKLGHDIESRLGNKDAALDYARRLKSQFPDSELARAIEATATP